MSSNKAANFKFAHIQANFFFNKLRFSGSRKIARKISKLFLKPLRLECTVDTLYGYKIEVSPKWGEDVYYLGFYEAGTLQFIDLILKGSDRTYIDIGANIGLMSLHAAHALDNRGQVISFEPVQFFFNKLNSNIAQNNFKNIKTFKMGIGSSQATIPIYLDGGCPSVLSTHRDKMGATEMINIDTLDNFMNTHQFKNIDFIKIDVEGFEFDVLKGAVHTIKTHTPVLCIEYIKKISDQDFNASVLIGFLKGLNPGYRFFQFKDTSRVRGLLKEVKQESDFNEEDNVFCISERHLKLIDPILQ